MFCLCFSLSHYHPPFIVFLILFVYYLISLLPYSFFFFFNDPATTEIYTLSLHDAFPISHGLAIDEEQQIAFIACTVDQQHLIRVDLKSMQVMKDPPLSLQFKPDIVVIDHSLRSEEHTSELQSPCNLVCRLLLEKKKNTGL